MWFLSFIAMLVVIYTLGWFDINIWTALFTLVFGGLFMITLFGH